MRRFLLVVAALFTPVALLAVVDCSSFEPAPDATPSDDAPDAATMNDDATTVDAPAPALADARPPPARVVRCGDTYCNFAKNEVCCAYKAPSGGQRWAECIVGTAADCVDPPDGEVELVSECDDPSDCGPGLVCCHRYDKCADKTVRGSECLHPDNCAICDADAGNRRLACDPKRTGQCPAGQHCDSERTSLLADGYCTW